MSSTTLVARFSGDGVIDLERRPLGPVAAGEVRLRVDVCALCGSDKRLLRSGAAVVPGHEIAGTVVEVGPDAPEGSPDRPDVMAGVPGAPPPALPGQRVVVYIPQYCGSCRACRAGQTNRCTALAGLVGWQRDGGFAEYVDVPARCALPVPEDIPSVVAVLGLDTVGTAAHAIRLALRTQVESPSRTLVVGCGPLGLGVVSLADAMGLGEVDVIDPHEGRMATAARWGARPAPEVDRPSQYDVVVEVSGARAARATAQNAVVPGGAVVVLGESDEPYEMPATPRWRRTDCFTVRSFYFPLTEVTENWDLLRSTGDGLREALASPVTLAGLPGAFDRFVTGDLLKPYVVTEENL